MGSNLLPIFMAYRNFKIIYKNITLKKNVVFAHAYDYFEATKIAAEPLKKLGLIIVGNSYRAGTRTYKFVGKREANRYRAPKPDSVLVEIVDLHFNRKR